MTTLQFRELKAFGNSIKTEAARDLDLLRRIENTLDVLDVRCERLRQANLAADYFISAIKDAVPAENAYENEVDLVSLFEAARDSVEDAYNRWSLKHLCAVNAPELNADDGIVEAYAHLLDGIAALHDKLNTLCWIIREEEAERDTTHSETFTDVNSLFASIGV